MARSSATPPKSCGDFRGTGLVAKGATCLNLPPMTGYLLTAIIAYFIGSIPTGYLFGRARGVDIRQSGSGNIGATNVFRTLGKTAGITVLAIDAVKGFLPAKFLLIGAIPETREYHSMVAG